MTRYVLLSICGLLGVFGRYFVNSLAVHVLDVDFPAATLVINILGSFLIGLTYVVGTEHLLISEDLRIAIMAGLLGGFTTFSAFSLDTVSLFAAGRYLVAGLYVAGSVGGGIAATIAGIYVARSAAP